MILTKKKFTVFLVILLLVYVGIYIISWEHARNMLKQSLAANKTCIDSTYHYEYPPNQKPIYVQGNTEKCSGLNGYIEHGFLYIPKYKHVEL